MLLMFSRFVLPCLLTAADLLAADPAPTGVVC